MNLLKKTAFALIIISVAGFFIYGISNNDKIKALYKGTSNYFPEKVDFCDEVAPLEILDVKERLEIGRASCRERV